ncbi:MAG: HlyD family efflux transporter periplasmic adaptor subunit [Pegethrix bostrychoides GSE-TBD4-15B]|jgi:HlyD family secretion protein|uniref:HlyD family efflux transporter periplasmic adaptor subunit n=1 Tax=Pegethrix bostrychoides GSE-TBD4-15B TaxID=2839662 RepID=A0A951P8A4_9CYAN|nr:HlyD family efflux transporter periplasmic adaptor subunit [Pegethrix bostrychoides GSE-TBD4-15B]
MSNLPALRTLQPDQFLPSVGRWAKLGGLVLIGAIGATVTLAAGLKYSTSVRAAAVVRPMGELRLVQSGLAGRVTEILVQPNQSVRRGDLLARLDPTQLNQQIQQLQASLQQEQTQLNQLDRQVQLLDARIAAETDSTDQLATIAEAELDRDQRSFRDQQITTRSELAEAEAAFALASSEFQRYRQLAEGAVSQLQIEEKQAAVRVAEQRVARARAALNPNPAALTIAQQRLAQVASSRATNLAALRQERAALVQQQAELRSQQAETQQTLRQQQAELAKTTIRAPEAGVILQLTLRNPNQIVQAGETLAQIAPSGDALNLRATVALQDIGSVQLGQVAQIRVTACPYPDYGLLKGEVVAISPDAITSAQASSQLNSQLISQASSQSSQPAGFEVTIRPERLELLQQNRRCTIQAGMEAEATIIAQEETFFRFLLRKMRLWSGL